MKPETSCLLPWINLSTDVDGSLRPCCKFAHPNPANEYQLPNMKEGTLDALWNDQRFQNLRQAFLDGKKPKECQTCWDEDASGVDSFRTTFVKYKNISLRGIKLTPYVTTGPKSIDLKLNNVCNLKCRICGPQASSTFLKEHQEQFNIKFEGSDYWLSNKILGTANESVLNKWAKDLLHIEMTGGEPMASPENIRVLELLVNSKRAKNISITVNTNGTLYNRKFINLLTQFKHVTICLSIDDIGERFEYERYPAEWSTIQENLQKFTKLELANNNVLLNLFVTVSIYNVYYLQEYLDWSKQFNIHVRFNILHYDTHKSIKNLPASLKEIVDLKLESSNFDNIKNLTSFDEIKNFLHLPCENKNLIQEFITNTIALDKFRKQSFKDTFGTWGSLIMEYQDESTNS